MALVKLDIGLDQDAIQKDIREKLDGIIQRTLFLWDINEMAKQMCMSKSTLENDILGDPRMRLLERKKRNGKRYWFYDESLEVIREIMDEW